MNKIIDLIKGFEGLRLKAYQDVGGVWTIGYGTTGQNIDKHTVWTIEQAEEAIAKDVALFYRLTKELIKVPQNENQLAALTSFTYNLGVGALRNSTMLKKINNGVDGVANEFLKWDRVNGKPSKGLLNRRQVERALYLTPVIT